ncbi:MAG: hypothetical protein JNM63_12605, partial [Spirochaetia bacterium]|nr:hypothetical protein [Spirochaetia bacterium]
RLGDDSVSPSTKEGKFFLARPKGATIMKAAIYLFFENGFEALSQYILDRSTVVVQDDSGLPYKYFTPNIWEERLYGMYRRPGGVGGVDKVPYQKDLEKSYAAASKPFDFLYGYGILWGKDRCNLMVFHKKSTEPQTK